MYESKWVKYYVDQSLKPLKSKSMTSLNQAAKSDDMVSQAASVEGKDLLQQSKAESYPEFEPEMVKIVRSEAGKVQVRSLSYRLDDEFRAGSYILTVKDVTRGLPSRMRMTNTKILVKFVNLDEDVTETKETKGGKGKKK